MAIQGTTNFSNLTVDGTVTAPTITMPSGTITAVALTATSVITAPTATISGTVTAPTVAAATVVTAPTVTVAGTITAPTATIAGTITAGALSVSGYAFPKVIGATVGYSSFTDGTATATYALPGTIAAGAVFYRSAVTAIGQGFQGSPNATAVMVIGDGTDADRYSGTAGIDVFTTAAGGADAGTPSGVLAHTAAKTPVLTITPGSVWGSITAGTVSVRLYYFE